MINQEAVRRGIHHVALGAVGSTNDEAMARARRGDPLPVWVTAERQITGRGRQGAEWTSEAGNLYASLAVRVASRRLPELPLLASVALYDALIEQPGRINRRDLAIKWPNDLLLRGMKVSGILAESQADGDDLALAVVGIGVNLVHHPGEARYKATDFSAQGVPLDPADLFDSLSRNMALRLEHWQSSDDGFATIRTAWLERASGLGEPIEIRLPNETLSGRFDGMDSSGRLILHQAGQPDRLISAGEVFFPSRNW